MKKSVVIFTCLILLSSVMFVSAGIFNKNKITGQVILNADGWTNWLNRDNPSGSGDYETLSDFVKAGQVCEKPTKMEIRTVNEQPSNSIIHSTLTVGFYCLNSENPSGCLDYEVRFYCGEENSTISYCNNGECYLREADKVYPYISPKNRTISINYISSKSVKLIIDGVNTNLLAEDQSQIIGDLKISINNIFFDSKDTGISSVNFNIEKYVNECTDTDGGKNYYVKGTVTNPPPNYESSWTDACQTSVTLQEGSCIEDLGVHTYDCPNGCSNGACIQETNQTCTDSDGGKNYYVKGMTTNGILNKTDYCTTGSDLANLMEYYCNGVNVSSYPHKCPNGCADGACALSSNSSNSYCNNGECYLREADKVYPYISPKNRTISINYISSKSVKLIIDGVNTNLLAEDQSQIIGDLKISINNIFFDSKDTGISSVNFNIEKYEEPECLEDYDCPQNYECLNGMCVISEEESCSLGQCSLEGSCVPVCYRKSGEYCSITGEMEEQLSENLACDNSCECESNLCVNNQCISGNMIQRIIAWFNGLFGKSN